MRQAEALARQGEGEGEGRVKWVRCVFRVERDIAGVSMLQVLFSPFPLADFVCCTAFSCDLPFIICNLSREHSANRRATAETKPCSSCADPVFILRRSKPESLEERPLLLTPTNGEQVLFGHRVNLAVFRLRTGTPFYF